MITTAHKEWVADLGTMTCRNCVTDVIVAFEKRGKTLAGKIKDVPMRLIEQWAEEQNGHLLLQKTVQEAETVFLRSYFEKD